LRNRHDDSFIGWVIKLWPIVLSIIALIFAIVRANFTLNHIEKIILIHTAEDNLRDEITGRKVAVMEDSNIEVKNRLIRIENKQDEIIDKIRKN